MLFCTSGIVLTLLDLVEHEQQLTDDHYQHHWQVTSSDFNNPNAIKMLQHPQNATQNLVWNT